MPTNGRGEFSPEALKHRLDFWTGRKRAAELAAEERRRYSEEREHARRVAAVRRERLADAREIIRFAREDAAEQRHAARQQLDAVRMDPAYDLYRTWGRRMDSGTVYDARAWRSSGRLVPVTQRMRYEAGGSARREVVDWTDILDRDAQERGLDVQELPRHFERLRRQLAAAQTAARDADEARVRADADARELLR